MLSQVPVPETLGIKAQECGTQDSDKKTDTDHQQFVH